MPRFQMILHSRDYYSSEGSHSLILPKDITTYEEAEVWVKQHLKQILDPLPCANEWESPTHFRFDRGDCKGHATYVVDVVPLEGDMTWEEFVEEWNEDHPNNRPDDWPGW